jgi:hypothetical protein
MRRLERPEAYRRAARLAIGPSGALRPTLTAYRSRSGSYRYDRAGSRERRPYGPFRRNKLLSDSVPARHKAHFAPGFGFGSPRTSVEW